MNNKPKRILRKNKITYYKKKYYDVTDLITKAAPLKKDSNRNYTAPPTPKD